MNDLKKLMMADGQLVDLRRRMSRFPKELAKAKKSLEQERTRLEALRAPFEEFQNSIREKEATIEVALDTANKFEEHMHKVTNQKEYMAARAQVDEARRLNERLQAEITELRTRLEEVTPKLEEQQQRYNEVNAEFMAAEEVILKDQSEIEGKIAEQEAIVKSNVAALGEKLEAYYWRLVKGGMRPGIAPVVKSACGGCFMSLPPKDYNKLMQNPDETQICSHCSRILFYEPESTEEEASA